MAKDQIRMPSGISGITRFNEDTAKIHITPAHVVVLIAVVIIIMILLLTFGNMFFG